MFCNLISNALMLPAALSLASAVGPRLIDAALDKKDPTAAASPAPLSAPSGLMSSDDRVVLSSQSLPPNPPAPLGSSLGRSSSVTTFPFQDKILDCNHFKSASSTLFFSQLVSNCKPVKRHILYFRDAWVSNLEAVVFPNAVSFKYPITIDLAWTTADISPSANQVLATPASARITAGGLSLLHQGVLPADLGHLNPIVKSPIPYSNTPRLTISILEGSDDPGSSQAVVYIRGIIHASHPILTPES